MDSQIKYAVGDCVQINTDTKKILIGKIDEIQEKKPIFLYREFVFPEQLPNGREKHHSRREIFLTDDISKESFGNIIRKVNVLNFRDFKQIVTESSGMLEEHTYLTRQEYDIETQQFNPEYSVETLAIMPKENPDNLNSDFNENQITLNNGDKYKNAGNSKRFPNDDEDLESELANPSKQLKTDMDKHSIMQRWNQIKLEREKQQQEQANLKLLNLQKSQSERETSSTKPDNEQEQQIESPRNQAKNFKNVEQSQSKEIADLTARFQIDSGYNQLAGSEKKRQEVKERFFQQFLYGMFEMRNLGEFQTESEKKFINSVNIYDEAKKNASMLENYLKILKNRGSNENLSEEYKERCKILLNHLKDDKNYELRRRVLLKEITPQELCNVSEEELYSPDTKRDIAQSRKRELEYNSIREDLYLIKTTKGEEMVIDVLEDNALSQEEERKNYSQSFKENIQSEANLSRKQDGQGTDGQTDFKNSEGDQQNEVPIRDISNNSIKFIKDKKYADILKSGNSNIDKDLIFNILDLLSDQSYQQMANRVQEQISNEEIKTHLLEKLRNL